GLAAQAGLHAGERIVAVDGERVDSWSAAMLAVAQAAVLRQDAALTVDVGAGQTQQRTLALSQLPKGVADDEKTFVAIGRQRPQPPLAAPQKGMPAANAGMLSGDRIVRINDTAITDFDDIAPAIAAQAGKNPDLDITVQRNDTSLTLKVKAE